MFDSSHIIQINKAVGESGRLLKPEILESAFASLGYYPDELHDIASIARSVMQGHPFIDGNKRTGIVLLISGCENLGMKINKSDDEWVAFAIESVTQRWSVAKIVAWLKK